MRIADFGPTIPNPKSQIPNRIMGSTKHEKSFVDFDQPYEQNVIGLKGIVYFGVGLFLLIVITFGLMFALLNVFENDAAETKKSENPYMRMTENERLPPEPRLQLAPGFGVQGENGRVNLELKAPASEYRELHRQWLAEWKDGSKDPKTGAVSSLPIEAAKEKFLEQGVKARSGAEAEQEALRSRFYFSDASSGRKATEKRR